MLCYNDDANGLFRATHSHNPIKYSCFRVVSHHFTLIFGRVIKSITQWQASLPLEKTFDPGIIFYDLEVLNMKRVEEFLKKAGTYYLATVDGDQPRVRPFGTANIFEDKLYIQTGKSKDVSKQIHANPKVELCAFMNGEWLRVAGELVADDRREAKQAMLDAYPSLQGMYSADDDNTEVLYLKNATATFSSFTKAPEVEKF